MSQRVLRVLDGVQKGAQAPMHDQRLLIGNLLAECDVVLDVGRPQQHACLVRTSSDGWSVFAISGDLWVRGETVAPQETRAIASGDVMRLGEVSFCVADTATIDWSAVAIPSRAEATAGVVNAHPPSSPAPLQAGRRQVMAGMLTLAVLVLSGLGAGLFAMSSADSRAAVAPVSGHPAESAAAVIAGIPWASEVSVQPDTRHLDNVLLTGYLLSRSQAATLDSALRQKGLYAEHRWAAVDELSTDLARRLAMTDATGGDGLRYAGKGRFVVTSPGDRFDALHRLIQRALQDMPAVHGIELHLREGEAGAGRKPPAVIRYTRAEAAPGGVAVEGLEQLRPARALQRFEVNELRTGRLPSIVLDNGARYFEGSSLPGGAVLLRVRPGHLVVQAGDDVRRVELHSVQNE